MHIDLFTVLGGFIVSVAVLLWQDALTALKRTAF